MRVVVRDNIEQQARSKEFAGALVLLRYRDQGSSGHGEARVLAASALSQVLLSNAKQHTSRSKMATRVDASYYNCNGGVQTRLNFATPAVWQPIWRTLHFVVRKINLQVNLLLNTLNIYSER